MSKITDNKSKFTGVSMIAIIVAIVLGVVATFVADGLLVMDNAVLRVLRSIAIGLSTVFLTIAIAFVLIGAIKGDKFSFIVAGISGWLGLMFLLVSLAVIWWAILIVAIATAFILLFAFIGIYRKTVTLTFDNEKPEYKDWKTREAEKAAAEPVEEEEELPEIKSFK